MGLEYPETRTVLALCELTKYKIVITRRQTKFEITRNNNFKIGLNNLSNKLNCISRVIELKSLQQSFALYKRESKIEFAI
jgi:hypothetical protein